MSCHTVQSSKSVPAGPVPPAVTKFQPLSHNIPSFSPPSHLLHSSFPPQASTISVSPLSLFTPLPPTSASFHPPPSFELWLRRVKSKQSVCPCQSNAFWHSESTTAYWHGVSHHPGSAQHPGHCCCGLCLCSLRIDTAWIWSPESRQGNSALPTFVGSKTQYSLFVVSVRKYFNGSPELNPTHFGAWCIKHSEIRLILCIHKCFYID